ncbi:MAG TPA: DUF484 family protein [Rhizomicrobium sp.]|nr:DUF484 family protein [Rhizomicrobium sp.]
MRARRNRAPKAKLMDRAQSLEPAMAAAEAVKAYIRMHREKLAADGELLALLLPERFADGQAQDFQRFVIDRLTTQNATLKAERDGLKSLRVERLSLGEGVRGLVLDLIDARTFEEAVRVATHAAQSFGADKAALCVEGDGAAVPKNAEGVRMIPPGTVAAVLGREGTGAILSGGGELLLGAGGAECKSLAAFRLKIGRDTPAALYVLGALSEGSFEGEETAADLSFFARALERAIRAWLDLPKT